jgi:hypothetical protein
MKPLPCLALTAALIAAGVVLIKRPTGEPAESAGAQQVDPLVARPWPESMQLSPFAREMLVREVIDGRRTLLQAATLFRELHLWNGQPWDRPWVVLSGFRLPGGTPGERLCQQVEAWVRGTLDDNPERCDTVLTRLERELRDAPREHGEICLPDPASLESVEQLLADARDSLTELQRRNIEKSLRGLR